MTINNKTDETRKEENEYMSGMFNEFAATIFEHVRGSRKVLSLEEIQAMDLDLRALRSQHEPFPEAKEDFTWVEGVEMTPQLAANVRQYFGCPRGPMGLKGKMREASSIAVVLEYLSDAKPYVLRGQDERFVCIPEMWYDYCLNILAKLKAEELI